MSRKYAALHKNETLLRRARLRREVNSHSGPEGYSTIRQLAEALGEPEGTTRKDLQAVGAVQVADTIEGKRYEWWIIPAHNPLLPNYREAMDETMLLNELGLKIRAHVLEMFVYGHEVIVKTERSAGPLLADWISLLPWPEIMAVSEQRSSCIIKSTDAEAAAWIMARLTGKEPEPS